MSLTQPFESIGGTVGALVGASLGLVVGLKVGTAVGFQVGLEGLSSEQHFGAQAERNSFMYSSSPSKYNAAVAQL